ncbi:MAG: FAD-dependent oxidoreductase [Promethearchaeota archaeon]
MTEPRIGFYICHCGTNIAEKINVQDVLAFAKNLPKTIVAKDYTYLCSAPGQDLIKNDIRDMKLNRLVVAACSPSLHERTFRKMIEEGGANPFYLQIANVREQVSWVTEDIRSATEKAKALIQGAVQRVVYHEALEKKSVEINPNILVIGGGIAGITSALTLADANKKVYLVEREPTIGGHMAKFDKTFPTLDCASCILTPKMNAVKDHPNIELFTCSEVESVKGYVGNFEIVINRKPRYIKEDKCTGCLKCIEFCIYKKAKFPDEFRLGLGKRKPIYIPFQQAIPLKAIIDSNTCLYLKNNKCERTCVEACEANAIDFDQKEESIDLKVGAIIIATGYKTFDPKRASQYGYGKYSNVYTSLEVEVLLNSGGPTGGKIILRDGTKPKSVAIIHCIGSRDENYNLYCSTVCCMYSLKLAHLLKDKTEAEIYNFYTDMRTAGKGFEEFYRRILEEGGIHFIRGKVARVTDFTTMSEENGRLFITVEDTLAGFIRSIPVDMVVLAVGLEPQTDAKEIMRLFNISCSPGGWFLERHPKLAPISTFTDGIFLAGVCQGPKDIPDSVAQAEGAAGEALSLIDRGTYEIEPITISINEDFCSGCCVCVGLCSYNALKYDEEKEQVVVTDILCKGCGLCSAACPSGAIQLNLFTEKQVLAEIAGVLAYKGD